VRTARQELVPGWRQERLATARVAVIGLGNLGAMTALALCAQGVGTMTLLDAGRAGGAFFAPLVRGPGAKRVAFARLLSLIDPGQVVVGVDSPLANDSHAALVPECDVLVVAGGGEWLHGFARELAERRGVPAILAGASSGRGWLRVSPGSSSPAPRPGSEGPLPSQLIGGLVAGEVRKLLLPLACDVPPQGRILYDLAGAPPLCVDDEPDREAEPPERPPAGALGGHVLLAGAGGLGTWTALALALAGVGRLTIVDPDAVEETNLNRQVLFYGGVGQPKATLLADRLQQMCPRLRAQGIVGRVESIPIGADIAAVCCAVDTFRTRAHVDRACRAARVPLVAGGTDAFSGTVDCYVPGETACLECRLGVSALAAEEEGRARCGAAPEPSHVVPNQVTGVLMAVEAARALAPELWGEATAGAIEFDALDPRMLGIHPPRAACACHETRTPS